MKRPWMPLYIEDYRGATARLNAAQHGAYLLLIMEYWREGGLPTDDQQLARIACMSDAEWRKNRDIIARYFDAHWKHERVEQEIKHAAEVSEARRQARNKRGYKSGYKRSNKTATIVGTIEDTLHTPQLDDDDDARASGSTISPEAFALADRLILAAGWDRDEPSAIGVSWTAQKWLNEGLNPDLCVDTVKRVRASVRKKINTLAYFEKPIMEAHAEQKRALPVVNHNPEVIHAQASQRHPGGAYGASKDRFRDAHADLKALIAEQDDSDGGGPPVEFLPAARRG